MILTGTSRIASAADWHFLPVGQDGKTNYAAPGLDTAKWLKAEFPHRDFDKLQPADNVYGWYRCSLSLPQAAKSCDILFNLGIVDDADVSYCNGVQIGRIGSASPNAFVSAWNRHRRILVPSAILRPGQANTIAVQVFDRGGIGGILSVPRFGLCLPPADQVQATPDETDSGLSFRHATRQMKAAARVLKPIRDAENVDPLLRTKALRELLDFQGFTDDSDEDVMRTYQMVLAVAEREDSRVFAQKDLAAFPGVSSLRASTPRLPSVTPPGCDQGILSHVPTGILALGAFTVLGANRCGHEDPGQLAWPVNQTGRLATLRSAESCLCGVFRLAGVYPHVSMAAPRPGSRTRQCLAVGPGIEEEHGQTSCPWHRSGYAAEAMASGSCCEERTSRNRNSLRWSTFT